MLKAIRAKLAGPPFVSSVKVKVHDPDIGSLTLRRESIEPIGR
jgi:hypothetical protein